MITSFLPHLGMKAELQHGVSVAAGACENERRSANDDSRDSLRWPLEHESTKVDQSRDDFRDSLRLSPYYNQLLLIGYRSNAGGAPPGTFPAAALFTAAPRRPIRHRLRHQQPRRQHWRRRGDSGLEYVSVTEECDRRGPRTTDVSGRSGSGER